MPLYWRDSVCTRLGCRVPKPMPKVLAHKVNGYNSSTPMTPMLCNVQGLSTWQQHSVSVSSGGVLPQNAGVYTKHPRPPMRSPPLALWVRLRGRTVSSMIYGGGEQPLLVCTATAAAGVPQNSYRAAQDRARQRTLPCVLRTGLHCHA